MYNFLYILNQNQGVRSILTIILKIINYFRFIKSPKDVEWTSMSHFFPFIQRSNKSSRCLERNIASYRQNKWKYFANNARFHTYSHAHTLRSIQMILNVMGKLLSGSHILAGGLWHFTIRYRSSAKPVDSLLPNPCLFLFRSTWMAKLLNE